MRGPGQNTRCPACAEKDVFVVQERLARLEAEARATAAEQELACAKADLDEAEDRLLAKLAAAEQREAERASDVPVEAVTGITVAGARAYWALKDLEKRHEALRVAVMIAISNPYPESWPEARVELGKALASPSTPSPADELCHYTAITGMPCNRCPEETR